MRKRNGESLRAILIHSPKAGDEPRSGKDLVEIIEGAGFQVRYQSTAKSWKKSLQKPTDLIVAAGGDGTVADVMLASAEAGLPVAILPLGTANNIGRSLGIVGDARELVEDWDVDGGRRYDIGLVEGKSLSSRFVEGVGGGLFAESITHGEKAVDEPSHLVGHALDRGLSLIQQLLEDCEVMPWTVEVDGRDFSGDYLAVEVMSIRFCGPSIPIAADADPSDGVFDVVLIGEGQRMTLASYVSDRLAHASGELGPLPVERGKQVRLVPPNGPLRIDDEVIEWDGGPIQVMLDSAALRVLSPHES
jgi:diacylglycerol kinase family enzyme